MAASRWRLLVVVSILATAAGCAQTATFQQLRPAQLNVPVRRLAVMHLPSPRSEAQQAHDVIWSQLHQSAAFQLVDQHQLQRAAPAPLLYQDRTINMPAALEAARRMGLDGLLVTKVRFVEHDGKTYGSKTFRVGEPKVAAAVEYEIVDARTGSILERSVLKSEFFRGELDPFNTTDTNSETKVLARLAREGGLKVAQALAPHHTPVEVRLAHAALGPGAEAVRDGIGAAKEGDWPRAREHFAAAAQADAQNDAALYNLGLACEATGDFWRARQSYQAALQVKNEKDYQQALDRLERAEAEVRLARLQQAGHAWPGAVAGGPPPRPQPAGYAPPR